MAADQETTREASRVTRSGGRVALEIFTSADRSEAIQPFLAALGPLMPPGISDMRNLFIEPGGLDDLARRAGLEPEEAIDIECPWVYPDLDTLQRGWLSAGPATLAVQHSGEETVGAAIGAAVERFKAADGGYRLENVFQCLIVEA